MVQDRGIGGAHLGFLHPEVFRDVSFYKDELIIDRALRRDLERLRHFDHKVRLDIPAFLERTRRWTILRIAFGRAVVNPRHKCLDLGVAQSAVVQKVPDIRVGKPWRHLLSHDRRFDGLRPGTRIRVAQERHRSHLTRPVALLAVLLQNRKDVSVGT